MLRNFICRLALCASSLLLPSQFVHAQVAQKPRTGPRALAVVSFAKIAANGAPLGSAVLIPITLLYNGQYFDATIYQAQPVPMAVEAQTVYEVQRGGMPLGLFTVTEPKPAQDSWLALGDWTPTSAGETESASAGTSKKPSKADQGDDERPVLTRGSGSSPQPAATSAPATAPSAQAPAAAQKSGEAASGESSTAASQSSASAQNQNNTATDKQSLQATYESEQQAPGRPVLRRGTPATETPAQRAAAEAAADSAAKSAVAEDAHYFVAISDAEPSDDRPYEFKWTADEKREYSKAVEQMALTAARDYDRKYKLPEAAEWQKSDIRAFDLFTDNNAEIVFSGTQAIAGARPRTLYVTVVGMTDATGEVHSIFTDVTDSSHLDVEGRLQLIDAVDSSGTGRGDLLFRRISEDGQSFVLYRVTGDQLWKLFDSNAS